MSREKVRYGLAIDAAVSYVALADHLIKPPLPPGLMAEYLNQKTKYSQLLPDYPMKPADVTRYRRRIKERDLHDSRFLSMKIELAMEIANDIEYWTFLKKFYPY